MEKVCRFCSQYDKGHCAVFEGEAFNEMDKAKKYIFQGVEDTLSTQMADLEFKLDRILDTIDGINDGQICEIGELLKKYTNKMEMDIRYLIEDNIEGAKVSITDDTDFYCSYWR